MIFFPLMGKKLDKIRLGSLTEVWHGGYDGVQVEARIDVVVTAGGQQ